MLRRYHYAPQREIYEGVLAVCRVDLVLRVGGAGWSRYPKFRERLPVWHSLDRSKGLRGDAVRRWRRSHWRKIQHDQYGVELRRRGVSPGPIARRLECQRLSTRGRGSGECCPPPCHLGGLVLGRYVQGVA